jgi:predicted dehydrogenase
MKKVIVVGAGNWGKNLVQNFYALGSLAGVADTSLELRQKIAAAFPGIDLHEDFRQVLDTDVSALVFATPAPTHYKFAMAALEAGKDVFIEKPMTLNSQEAIDLSRYADQHNQILMVGHLLLYQPAIAWLRDYLATGKAGKIFHIMTQRTKLGKVRQEENVWWSFAPHDVSVVLDLLGNPQLQEVRATGHAMLQNRIEDNAHVDLTFASGQTAHIHVSWYHPLLQRSTTIIAEKQMLVYDELTQQVTVYDKSIDSDFNNIDAGNWVPDLVQNSPLQIECEHFLNCLETRQQPRTNGWNGVSVVEVLEKVQEAIRG